MPASNVGSTNAQPSAHAQRDAALSQHSSAAALPYSASGHPNLYDSLLRRDGSPAETAYRRNHAGTTTTAAAAVASTSTGTTSERDDVTAPSSSDAASALSPSSDAPIAGGTTAHTRRQTLSHSPSASPSKASTSDHLRGHHHNSGSGANGVSGRSLRDSDGRTQHRSANADFYTVVSTTTAKTGSSTRVDSRAADEKEKEGRSGRSRVSGSSGAAHLVDDAGNSAGPSAACTLLDGAPPPSGLRDPVTLLQLLPLDRLLQPANGTPHHSLSTGKDETRTHTGLTMDVEQRQGASAQTGGSCRQSSASLSSGYDRAFSLLRCAVEPSSTLSRSRSWRGCRDRLDVTRPPDATFLPVALRCVMAELEHRHQVGEPPLRVQKHPSPYGNHARASPQLAQEGTVLLCSLANDMNSAQQDEQQGESPQQEAQTHPSAETHAGDAADSCAVPLVFFAATVECPPDVQRFFLLSRTHAYLCDPDGTVAYCAAVRDVRQIVACAGGYTVWRFMPDVAVSSMLRRKAVDAAAYPSSPASLTPPPGNGSGSGSTSPTSAFGSPTAAATAREIRDEMSDWVFRIVSVGGPRAAAAAAAVSSPASATDSGDSRFRTANFSTSVGGDGGVAEGRHDVMVFLLNVMCTLRTLPRLLIDTMVNASTAASSSAAAEFGGASSSSSFTLASNRLASSRSSSGNGGAAAWDRSKNVRGRAADRLDRMHVAGDQPARVPLLLEGPVGHQTAVKFIEQHWTTRYDQLPPSLRPRRLSPAALRGSSGPNSPPHAPAASAMEGGTGARVCYVESSLLIPPIPVLALEACLDAEDAVVELLQTTSDAVRATLSTTPANVHAASPAKPPASAKCGTIGDEGLLQRVIPLKNLSDAAAKERAKAELSPAAWGVLEELLHRSGEGYRGGPVIVGPALMHEDSASATTLTTPVISNPANTRAHSEDSSWRSSSHSADHRAAVPSGRAAAATPVDTSSGSGRAMPSRRRSTGESSRPAATEAFSEPCHLKTARPAHGVANRRDAVAARTASTAAMISKASVVSSSSTVDTTAEEAREAPMRVPQLSLPRHLAGIASEAAPASADDDDTRPVMPKSLTSAQISASGDSHSSGVGNSPSNADDPHKRSGGEVEKNGGIAPASPKGRLLHAVSNAVREARLRRPRDAAASSTTHSPHTDRPSSEAEHHSKKGGHGNTVSRVPAVDTALKAEAEGPPSTLSLPIPTDAVAAFERRIQHRPRRDRLLLRARYIRQLLQTPLGSSSGGVRGGPNGGRVGDEEQRPPPHDGPVDATRRSRAAHTAAAAPLVPEDPDQLVEDLRRQRVIAELMCIQQFESSSSSDVATVPPHTPSSCAA
ncbi:hypothetical protein ABB37_10034 [Leptomonas pyrrhocoris]|uniref:Uncharacterized protein n=1 Tax=Leptomonas pyrrhocoris TaxID=157538 RepID=A0A0N0VCQ6_LEPPY|nr:hypothetical protein ABB37_10034 [Leptomonas pyrrhocoris]XP_015651647.1 hypothetical protein ABB37_10034 [Leptomonas pyrrhocoris]KPA73207.1 hypothetical protein ABB37_10034 [Leptomonas pyrrhocoris]KPA73208.1 hypothetical protein ABB37_10034 [Leptomonas pyrrhocoris]|eukprot:XP_015651646.1 hypothetical protein ABB37_10034 [Leptomonas pyrrhocoris]